MARTPVWLYVPNLIGYFRVITGFAAFVYAFDASKLPAFFGLYFVSYMLDACDGVAARRLKQTSRWGAVLDMVTDRICTAALLAALAHIYSASRYHVVFLYLLMLDVGSHWVQMYSALASGGSSHKSLVGEHPLVRLYYNAYYLFSICLANETCLVMLFLHGQASVSSVAAGASPWPFKAVVPAVPALGAPAMPVYLWLAILTAPVALLKQTISILQLWTAARRIIAIDEHERDEKEKGTASAAQAQATPGKAKGKQAAAGSASPGKTPASASKRRRGSVSSTASRK